LIEAGIPWHTQQQVTTSSIKKLLLWHAGNIADAIISHHVATLCFSIRRRICIRHRRAPAMFITMRSVRRIRDSVTTEADYFVL
jgi:hypothetical protein